MVLLRDYLKKFDYPDAVFDYICLRSCIDAGLPILFVAPVGSGKSTILQAIKEKYVKQKWAVQLLERISPLRMLSIQDAINNKDVLFISEDFSTVGQDINSTYSMMLMVAKISYDKTYRDTLFTSKQHPDGLEIKVKKLAFLCGMQPIWLSIYTQKEVFETLIGEKILRYYRLPIYVIKKLGNMDAIKSYLNKIDIEQELPEVFNLNDYVTPYYQRLFTNAMMIQCGNRANEYAPLVLKSLCKYIPKEHLPEWIKQFALRLEFEKNVLLRFYTSPLADMPVAQVLHKEYSVLYHTLAFNPLDLRKLALYCKIRGKNTEQTRQYAGWLVKQAQDAGFVFCLRHRDKLRIYPSRQYLNYSLYSWRIGERTETQISIEGEDNVRIGGE